MSCRTSRSAVGAGNALLDGGLSVGISGGRAPSWTSSCTSALTVGTSRATRRRGVVFALAVERNGAGDPHEVKRQSRPWRRRRLVTTPAMA